MSISLIQTNASYALLQFTKQEKLLEPVGNNFTVDNFSQYYIDSKFSTVIEIGTPPQKVELIYSSDNYGISMIEDKNSTISHLFNKNLSSSLDITHEFDQYFFGSDKPVTLIDSILFPFYDTNTNKTSKIKVNEYPFVYLTKVEGKEIYENTEFIRENGKAYMIYGSKVYCKWKKEIGENIPHFLKHNKLIDSYIFNIDFSKNPNKDNYDFEFKIGYEPHQISPDIYDKDSLLYINPLSYDGEVNWILKYGEVFFFPEGFKLYNNSDDLNEISFNKSLNDAKLYTSSEDRSIMAFDMDIILCPKFYYFAINKTYFGNHTDECKIQFTQKKLAIFVCNKDFNTESFPSIYFYHRDYNYTFILTHKELFKVIGDKKYFLLVYDLFRPTFWMFGKIFLEKYLFNYDMENKLIGFYRKINTENNKKEEDNNNNKDEENNKNKNEDNKNNNLLLINLIWIGVVLIIGIASFFIGKYLCTKIRKKRANELDDDNYDYQINEENSEKDNNNGEEKKDNNNNAELCYNKIVD